MRKRSQIVVLVTLCLVVSGCGSTIPLAGEIPTPSIMPVLTDQPITVENASSLTEVARLVADDAGPVASLAFAPDVQVLLAAYGHEGKLRHWQLASGKLLRTVDVHPIGLGGAAFNSAGTLLVTGAGAEWNKHRFDDEYLGWQVWDTQTGEAVEQLGKNYESTLTRSLCPDILLSPDGHWVLMITASADTYLEGYSNLSIWGLTTEETSGVYIDFSRKAEEDDFDVIAFDVQGDFFAAADESGKVAIFPFRPPQYPNRAQAVIEDSGDLGLRHRALVFDVRRRWLAGVRGTELLVWDLRSPRFERHLEVSLGKEVGPTASLAFDPSGTLLGVGSATGWQVWNVEDKQLVAQGTGIRVYAVTFSPDGRLFAWGDDNGVVHLSGLYPFAGQE
jgi:WD40 repeat protein